MDIGKAAKVAAREDEGIVVHLRDENEELSNPPTTVRIAGSYSAVYRRTQDNQMQRMLKRRQMTLTPEQVTRNRIELVATCILGWEGFTNNGQPYPFTKDNAVNLLTQAPWIRQQLEDAQADHASFGGGSSGT